MILVFMTCPLSNHLLGKEVMIYLAFKTDPIGSLTVEKITFNNNSSQLGNPDGYSYWQVHQSCCSQPQNVMTSLNSMAIKIPL